MLSYYLGYKSFDYDFIKALELKWYDVVSSNVHSVAYSAGSQILYIKYLRRNGAPPDQYLYYDVPFIVFRKLLNADSKGKNVWANIRNKYRYEKI